VATRRRSIAIRLAALGLGAMLLLGAGELVAALALRASGTEAPGADEARMPPSAVWLSRDEHRERKKDWFRYRIVCIGDSCTYGIGYKPHEAYPAQLERLLNEGQPFRRFEVLNLGIAGYSSHLGLTRLREMALGFEPDLLIASFGLNDKWRAEMSDLEAARAEASLPRRARYAIGALLERSHLFRLLQLGLAPVLRPQRQRFANLAVDYRVSLEQYRANLTAIAREARAAGTAVVFVSMAETPAIERLTEEGIEAFGREDWQGAADALQRLADIKYMYYPRPMYYLAQAYERLGDEALARRTMRLARQLAVIYPFPHAVPVDLEAVSVRSHLDGVVLAPDGHFDIYARYREALAAVGRDEGVPSLYMTGRDLVPSDFFDYCHLTPSGYAKVARAVAGLLQAEVLPRAAAGQGGAP
jgi:lysophospholipase L1-like esterase